jgi:hypothetical protein
MANESKNQNSDSYGKGPYTQRRTSADVSGNWNTGHSGDSTESAKKQHTDQTIRIVGQLVDHLMSGPMMINRNGKGDKLQQQAAMAEPPMQPKAPKMPKKTGKSSKPAAIISKIPDDGGPDNTDLTRTHPNKYY